MGVFGFLSKSHIEQASVGAEQIALAEAIDEKMARSEAKIKRWQENIQALNKGETGGRIDSLIAREQQRIKDANARLQPQIDAENAKIPVLRSQAQTEIGQQEKRLVDAQKRAESAIKVAQDELTRLDADVEAYTKQGTTGESGLFSSTTDNVAKGAELRAKQKPERDKLQEDIDRAKANELSIASRVQAEIRAINGRLAASIKEVEARIATLRKSIDPTVKSANENIERYTLEAGNANNSVDTRIANLEKQIENEQPIIDQLREEKFVFEKTYRQFEAEVGPVKYIAELIYGAADTTLLEEAVRWVIIIIVAVFDPLAVCLVLAGTMNITWWRQERGFKKKGIDEIRTNAALQQKMQIKDHNNILGELEKLIDDNLANVNPLEYDRLKDEYDGVIKQRDILESQLSDIKSEAETLVDKVVTTEAERDDYKKKLDNISQGAQGLETRIVELLERIKELESEVERRDAVVLKMAEKYQLVEKDTFATEVVEDAQSDPKAV
jgi:chromosome segregation ATPase